MKFACNLGLLALLALPLGAQPLATRPLAQTTETPASEPTPNRSPQLDLQGLGLTPDQQRKIRTIQQEDQTNLQTLRQQAQQAQQEFRRALVSPAEDGVILRKFEQHQQLQKEVARMRVENFLRIRAVLTPQQRQQLQDRNHQ